MRTSPTMVDVARVAGVSLKTVSRVVNDEPGVSSETALRVRQAVETLGYRANDVARSLRRGQRAATIGLVIEDVRNPFYSSIARAVEETARLSGHIVVIANSDENPVAERKAVGTLLSRQVTGLLIVPAGRDHSYLLEETRRGTPAVFMDRPPGNIEADAVLLDNAGGARLAADHLVRQGHRRVGVVGDPGTIYTVEQRVTEFRDALASMGVRLEDSLVRLGARDVSEAEAAMYELLSLKDSPSGVFATNNRASVGALRALRASGAGVALVGFDDFELADVLSVTVIRHDPLEMGRRAAELLLARLAGDDRAPQTIVLPTELVVRGPGEVTE
jgi:LacI family transcriptional regulator